MPRLRTSGPDPYGLIGLRLYNARKRAGLTQWDLAVRVGHRRRQNIISLWETGRRRPSIADIWELCRALGMTVDELAGFERPDERG